ncbi:Starch-binding associating with outer membrane [Fodinibius roseus]|uniref:Starch-binding associating with outer membrane n=1 Tax=Fodinibius roseus TaxID=1194090 RepID=A0A1M5L2U6_9BACT|nr:RagB/SusD family nutrient uptake outer membrane protein [Fodinibius roseus]SHG59311.1 Starch-binding associating with outer membrane [Fodinibius roseus]
MKNINYFLGIIILLLITSSCDDSALVSTPRDFLTPSNAYNTPSGIEQGITGLYNDVRDKWYRNRISSQSYGLFGMGTDVAYDGENPQGQRFLTNYQTSVTPQQEEIAQWWRYLYAEIQQANTLIRAVNNLDENSIESSEKNHYLAEARFFRAFAHRLAVVLWGDVPLVTDVIEGEKTDFVRTPKADVYEQIEKDLLFATEHLPVPGSEPAPGRLTQGAAWHLLTKAYLGQDKFQLAVESSSHVIDDYNYELMKERFGSQRDFMGPGNVYADLFNYDNQNTSENTETIWAIQFEPNVEGGSSNYWAGIFGPRPSKWGNTPDGYAAYSPQFQDSLGEGVARARGTNLTNYKIWESDWNNDIRNAKINIKRKYYFDNPKSEYDGQVIKSSLYDAGDRTVWKDTSNYIYPFFLKTFSPVYQAQTLGINPAEGGGGSIYTDFYAMRLAETYLLRAEAHIGMGNKTLAAKDINVVRERAEATPVSPGDVDIDYLLNERVRELYTEEMRLIVLMRMDKLVERTREYNDNPFRQGANIQDHNKLFPIPQQQIDLNNNAEFKQNPGY